MFIFRYYGKGSITHDNYVQFIRHDTLGFEYLDQSKNFVPQVAVNLLDVGRGKFCIDRIVLLDLYFIRLF